MHIEAEPDTGPDTESTWWEWLAAQMDERSWSPTELARQAAIDRSLISRWKAGGSVTIDFARKIAATLDLPLLTVLVAAKLITREEAGVVAVDPEWMPSAADLTRDQLVTELDRRLRMAEEAADLLTEDDVDEEPGKWATNVTRQRKRTIR